MSNDNNVFDLNLHCYRLLMEEPFFAALSRRLDKSPSSWLDTAGVGVDPSGKFVLHYNPEYMGALPDNQKKGVLKHEFYHLVFEHVTGRAPSEGLSKSWNFATDLAINGLIPRDQLPEGDGCCYPGEGPFADMPIGKSAEWYHVRVKKLMEEEEAKKSKEGKSGSGEGEGNGGGEPGDALEPGEGAGDHSMWQPEGSGDAGLGEVAKERLRKAMKDAVEEAQQGGGWGSVPSEVRESIINSINVRVDFKKVLRYFVKTSQRASKKSTIKRINKRYPYIHPGRKAQRRANLAIAVDQSGSVSDDMLELFFAALNDLSTLATFTIVPFDTEVCDEHVEVWKKGEKRNGKRVRFGGTDFNAPTKWVNTRTSEFDGLIVLTDMEAPKPVACKVPRLWGTDPRGAQRPYFQTNERIMVIEK
jgi:predicted metal-dependent peptidase